MILCNFANGSRKEKRFAAGATTATFLPQKEEKNNENSCLELGENLAAEFWVKVRLSFWGCAEFWVKSKVEFWIAVTQ